MSTKNFYDSIVIGTGGVGSAALYHLASKGEKVLGMDRFQPPHNRGSSHGQTRIIRQAYFEGSDYTPLVLEAYKLWEELENRTGKPLYSEIGVLQIGSAEGEVVRGVVSGAEKFNLPVEMLTAEEIERRWPALIVPAGMVGVLESRAGFLRVEDCVEAHISAARAEGAELLADAEVLGWEPGPPVIVKTAAGEFHADRLVIAAGAWAGSLLSELGLRLEVLRKSLFWYPVAAGEQSSFESMPAFLYDLPEGVFYGFPPTGSRGMKFAEHSGGQPVADPLRVNREVELEDRQRIEQFITGQLRGVSSQFSKHCVCLYTMATDERFIVDRHPEHPHVAFAAGLSGHGFKFTAALGKALADLVTEDETDMPIEFLALP